MRLHEVPAVIHLSTGREVRGGERQLLRLHEGLIARGLESHVICRKGSELSQRLSDRVSPVTWRGLWDIGGLLAIERICGRSAPAILHCHDSHAFSAGTIAGTRAGTPVVYTRRVAFPIRNTWLNRRRYGRCRHIMAVSRAVADQCEQIAPDTPISVVHDGVSWGGPSLDREEIKRRLGVTDETFIIGSVGFFTGEKNADLLVTLAERLLTTHPQVQILVVGPLASGHEKCFARVPNVAMIGKVPVATDYYSAFDLYVSTSTREGLGSALIDAVVRDIPVVALDSGGVRDVLPDGSCVAADEHEFLDAVEKAVTDYETTRREALEHGVRVRSDFTVERMVEKTLAVYEDVVCQIADWRHTHDLST